MKDGVWQNTLHDYSSRITTMPRQSNNCTEASSNSAVNNNLAAWLSNNSMEMAVNSNLEAKPVANSSLEGNSNSEGKSSLEASSNLAEITSLGVTFDG